MGIIDQYVTAILHSMKKNHVDFTDKSVLITGGAGFIGSWLCDVFIKMGSNVICLDNFSSGQHDNIEHLKSVQCFRLINHNISKPIDIRDNIDVVLHFASRASPFEFTKYPIQILEANTYGTQNALEIAKENEAIFLLASSGEVYGDPDPRYIPTPESYNGNVNITGIRSCYDEGKRTAEAFVVAYRRKYGLNTRIVRIHNTYGPRMRADGIYGRVIPRFINQALQGSPLTIFGDGTQTRSFTFVKDMIEGIVLATVNENIKGEVINLGSNVEIQILKLGEIIIELAKSNSDVMFQPLPKDDPKRRCPNIDKAMNFLNWIPCTSLKEGLEKTILWEKKWKITDYSKLKI